MDTNELSAFLFRICHDLRTPLRGIRAHTELLLKDQNSDYPGDLAQQLAFIRDGARSLDALIDAMAGYSLALQTSSTSFQPTKSDVMLRSAMAKVQPALQQQGGEVTYCELPRIKANPDRLLQLFEQLIRNSIDHRGSEPPRVRVSATGQDGVWTFSVSDNGEGVEPDEFERIFRPFERLHGKGAGLGLATCRAIVEGHGGKIWAEMPPEGFTIRFTLPSP